jgi:preprotein translocase subunit SecG
LEEDNMTEINKILYVIFFIVTAFSLGVIYRDSKKDSAKKSLKK